MKHKKVSITLPEEVISKIQRFCSITGRKVSSLVKVSVLYYMNKLDKD